MPFNPHYDSTLPTFTEAQTGTGQVDDRGRLIVASLEIGSDGSPGTPLTSGTNRSSSITVGGIAQVLAAANTARRFLVGQNISSGDLWINEVGGTATIDTAGSYKIPPEATFQIDTNRSISIIGSTTGQKWTATEG